MAQSDMDLFALAQQRLQWLGARQAMLSENLANADTPGWVARDIKPFADVLGAQITTTPRGGLETTDAMHLPGLITHDQSAALLRGEKAPDGNQVSVDVQMERIAQTDSQHEAVSAIYLTYMGMFRTALGK